MNCFSSDRRPGARTLQRMYIGANKGLSGAERIWYNDAIECYSGQHSTQFLEPICPKVTIAAQPFCAWKVMLDMNSKWKLLQRRKISLVQLGPMPEFIINFSDAKNRNFFQILAAFLSSYLPGLGVTVLSPITDFYVENSVKCRKHSLTNQLQYFVADVNKNLSKLLPADSLAILGVTWTDLYPSEDLNFVLGEASFADGAAVCCFGRFEPKIYMAGGTCCDIQGLDANLIYKMIRTVSHETCHLLGLHHCVYFRCAMNASDSLHLALSQPLFTCPFCTRKLQHVLGFSLDGYYSRLLLICVDIHELFPSKYMAEAVKSLILINEHFKTMKDQYS